MSFLLDPFTSSFMLRALLGGVLVAALCAVVGTWVVVRGMAFLGEAMAHGILPGVAVAALLGLPPVVGATASAVVMTAGVSAASRRGRLSQDTAIGLLFVAMLSLGVIIVSRSRTFATDLTAILFGDVLAIGWPDIALLAGALVLALTACVIFHRPFVAATFDPRVAHTLGLRPQLARTVLTALVTLAVIASYQAVGSLLVVGLLLAPAVAAGQWTRRVSSTMAVAVCFGAAAVVIGLLVSWFAATAAGASIAASAIGLVVASTAVRAASKSRVKRLVVAATAATLALVGCAEAPAPAVPHGYVEGATEMEEPQLRLVTVGRDGVMTAFDPATETSIELARVDVPERLSTDGRFVFSARPGVLAIVDSGAWTVPHGDHSHYYLAEPRVVGTVTGAGLPVAASSSALTAVTFAGSGETIILDAPALGRGEVSELGRIVDVANGAALPLKKIVVASGTSAIQAFSATGAPLGDAEPCDDPAGSALTTVGAVFGCSDGAVLATESEGAVSFERIPYPAGTKAEDRATSFAARPGRPAVAAVAGSRGAWLLNSRSREWSLIPTDTALVRAVAVSDDDDRIVALDEAGRIVVLTPSGETASTTALVDIAPTVSLEVDISRAYLNDPAKGVVFEIDYGDNARIARTLDVPGDAAFFVETGR